MASHWHPGRTAANVPTASGTGPPPLTAVGAELSGVQACGLEHDSELLGSTPTIRVLVECRHRLTLKPLGLPPVVEVNDVNAQLC